MAARGFVVRGKATQSWLGLEARCNARQGSLGSARRDRAAHGEAGYRAASALARLVVYAYNKEGRT
jgi:hypothetical protein